MTSLGECSPFPSLTGDTVEIAITVAMEICSLIKGRTVTQALEVVRNLPHTFRSTSITAVCGVEIALWDLAAKQSDQPLSSLCGSAALTSVCSDITLPIMKPEKIADFWTVFNTYEFEMIKIKVSGNLEADLDMIAELSSQISKTKNRVTYTLDGNQGYTVEKALALLTRLRSIGVFPECFEQPLPADDWQGLKKLSASTEVAVCLDETVKSLEDCQRVINEKTAKMINLKIMKSGFSHCMDIAKLSQKNGIRLMIGGMLESEIAMAASLSIACGLGGIDQFDLDTPFFFNDHPTQSSPWHRKKAKLIKSTAAGLGLSLKDSTVQQWQ